MMKHPYHVTTLPNGMGLVLHPTPHAQSVAIGIWVRAGARYEPERLAGVSHFLEHLLFKGTVRRSCEVLKRSIEGIGGSLNGFTAEEFTCYMAKVPHRYAGRALDVLSDMVAHPRLGPDDVRKERDVILEEIRMYEDTPGQYVHDLLSELLWPHHPLGTLISGTAKTIRRISRADIVRYWKRMYQPRNLLIAGVGALDPERLMRQATQAFGATRLVPLRRFPRAPRPRQGPQIRVWNKQTEQVHLCAGAYAMPRTHPDRFALELLHVLLGANMSSRLFREVRERRGLVYEIGTQVKRFHDTGAFIIYAGCDAGKLAATVRTIFAELSRIRRRLVSRTELKRAKDYYAGQLLMGLEDPMDHMLWVGEQAVTGGRVSNPQALLRHLAKVTEADIRRVAHRLFVTQRFHVVVGGPVAATEADRLARLCRIP